MAKDLSQKLDEEGQKLRLEGWIDYKKYSLLKEMYQNEARNLKQVVFYITWLRDLKEPQDRILPEIRKDSKKFMDSTYLKLKHLCKKYRDGFEAAEVKKLKKEFDQNYELYETEFSKEILRETKRLEKIETAKDGR